MQKYNEPITNEATGVPLAGIKIYVQNYPSGTAASVYGTDDATLTPLVQPLKSKADGTFPFYAPNGHYQLTQNPAVLPPLLTDFILYDPADEKPTFFEDYTGVDPTGVADSTAGLLAAIAANTYVKGKPGATYKYSSTLTITNKMVDFAGATLNYVGPVNTWAMVVNVGTGRYRYGAKNFFLTCTSADVVNRTHGVCVGGSNGLLKNICVQGFTGISIAEGSGVETETGVTLPAAAQALYWDMENVNYLPTAGWGFVNKASNNANSHRNFSSFPYAGLGDSTPHAANCINEMIIGGLSNSFERTSCEGSPSAEKILFLATANGNTFADPVYMEYNGSLVTPPFPRVTLREQSSGNKIHVRHPYSGAETINDLGTANDTKAIPTFYINGQQQSVPGSSVNLIKNGDFINQLTNWTDASVNTVITYGAGYMSGNSLRLDFINGRPSVLQDLVAIGGFALAALKGQNITVSAWIKTDQNNFKIRTNGVTQGSAIGDGVYHYYSSTTQIGTGAASVPILMLTETGSLTGYAEVSNLSVVVGNAPLAIAAPTVLEGSATYNPPSIAAAGQASTTVTVTGAVLGDSVSSVSFSLDLALVALSGYVSATNTVTCLFKNGTAGPIDLGSGTLKVRVTKQ